MAASRSCSTASRVKQQQNGYSMGYHRWCCVAPHITALDPAVLQTSVGSKEATGQHYSPNQSTGSTVPSSVLLTCRRGYKKRHQPRLLRCVCLCMQVRFEVLSAGKTLLTPQPRLRTGFFSTLALSSFPANAIMEACTSAGVAKYGDPLSLSDSEGLKVDMIVVGSSAVSRNGARLGKGEVSQGAGVHHFTGRYYHHDRLCCLMGFSGDRL